MTFLFLVSLLSITAEASTAQVRTLRAEPELVAALENAPASTETTTLAIKYKPIAREKRASLLLPSVVVHGFAIDKDVAAQMPRKLDMGRPERTNYMGTKGFNPKNPGGQ